MSTIGAGSDDLGGLRLVDIEEPVKPQTRSKPLTWSPPDPPECELAWQEWVKMRKQDRELEPRSPTDHLETIAAGRINILRGIAFVNEHDRIVMFIRRTGVWCGERRWLMAFASQQITLGTLLTESPSEMRSYYYWWNESYFEAIKPFLEALDLKFGMSRAQYTRRMMSL